MAVFEFEGIAVATGKPVRGVRDAENAKALRGVLRKDGILLTQAHEEVAGKSRKKRDIDLFKIFRRVSTTDIAMMTRQLATLVRAGIPLIESVAALTDQVENDELKNILTRIRERLNEGTSFAKSLEAHPRVFPPLYVNMVAAGEASGTLEAVLERLADFLESQSRLTGKVIAALAYPILMIFVGTTMIGGLLVFVVPKVTAIFDSFDRALPWYTQVLITASNVISGYWWLLAIVLFGGWWSFRRWVSTPAGRLRWDGIRLRMPIFGRLVRLVAVSRFATTLSTLLSSGVPLLKAMDIVKNVLGNAVLEQTVIDATGSIREGESIAEPLRRSGQFPPIVTHMIAVGEKSGELEAMLKNVATAYDAQVETQVQLLTSLLEPLMIVGLGGTVAFIAMAILMPLIQMNEFVQ